MSARSSKPFRTSFDAGLRDRRIWAASSAHRSSQPVTAQRPEYLTLAVLTGFEPATSTLTGWRALQAALQDLVHWQHKTPYARA
jgi:hypothetical protein